MSLFPPTTTRVTHNVTGAGKPMVPSLKKPAAKPSSPMPLRPKGSRCASCGKHKF